MSHPAKLPAHRYAKLFPPLSEDGLQALTEDVREHGVLQPATLTADPTVAGGSSILDGVHRQEAALAAGVELKFEAFEGTDEEKLAFVLSRNLHRRHLTESQRAIIAAKRSGPLGSNQGGDRSNGQRCTLTRADAAKEMQVGERTVKKAAALIEMEPETAEKILTGKSSATVHRALMQAKARKRLLGEDEARKAATEDYPEHAFYVCSCRELIEHVEPESVDVIICDPPYAREFLPTWSELGEFSKHALKPGGLLVAMSGQSFLPEVMQRLGQQLRWWWLVHYATPGDLGDNSARRVSVTGKPLLVYANGTYTGRVFGDTVRSEKSESQLLHEWGQSESGMTDAIQRFSNPGDLVADPFLGSGTTAVVALRNGRRFVGCDVEADCVKTTRTRLGL